MLSKPHKKWLVEYRLWVYDKALGLHITLFDKRYYTKIGARVDMYIYKSNSYRGSKAILHKEIVK